ncbi:fic/DOC family domain-containing protein [Ditylenchus destructor]|nr:fic/DOC family domain-containing protein [Ditylenchus destructor]
MDQRRLCRSSSAGIHTSSPTQSNTDANKLLFNRKALTQLIVLCIVISTVIQVFIPLLQLFSAVVVCQSELIGGDVKSRIFKCPTSSVMNREHKRVRRSANFVSYFDDPYVVQEWGIDKDSKTDSTNKEMILSGRAMTDETRPKPWIEAEAIAALHAAKRSREHGNLQRAKVIIEHAYSLAPYHPDILTEYGVFLETVHNNVVEAEGYYLRALAHDPQHSEALIRREKTLPLVEEIDNRMFKRIHAKREHFLKIPRTDPGLRRAMRESYFQHVYHTVALEGNTMSLIQTRSILETRMAVAGKSIIEHNEILGMDAALRFLNQTLTHIGELTLEDILAIHKRVLGFVDPLVAGVIRSTQVYVGNFVPTAPEFIMSEMEELISWLNDEETLRVDPVEMAALTHYKLVYIHPFIDGNGRTSRLLMNFILMQAGFPPVIIPVEERSRYYSTLQQANQGDLRPFIRFIAEQTDRTLEEFIASSAVCDIGECPIEDQTRGVSDSNLL